ncbi:MAG: RHS repeat-associated core domain-containing protein [Anaerolineae bacterium]
MANFNYSHFNFYDDRYGNPTGSLPLDFGFTGEQTDENGSVFLRARYYEPSLGVFNALDPMETPNRYAYVSGNPVNRVDPTGLFDWATRTVESRDSLFCIAREGTTGWTCNQPPSNYAVTDTYNRIRQENMWISNPSLIQLGWELAIPHDIVQIGLRNADKSCHPERVSNNQQNSECNPTGLSCPDGFRAQDGYCVPICSPGFAPVQRVNVDVNANTGSVTTTSESFVCQCVSPTCNNDGIGSDANGNINSSRVEVAGYSTRIPNQHHLFLIYRDAFGTEWEYRGGPFKDGSYQPSEIDVLTGNTTLSADRNVFDESGIDFRLYHNALADNTALARRTLVSGVQASLAARCLDQRIVEIDMLQATYWPSGPNSNTVFGHLAESCGINVSLSELYSNVAFPGINSFIPYPSYITYP